MHVRRILAIALAGPLLLAGCSDPEPTPKIPDPTPTSSTPSPTESETPEAESAEDFIRRWSDALQKMQATGNTEEFRALGPDCESCLAAADRVDEVYGAKGRIEWDGWKILSIEPIGNSQTEFRAEVDSAPTRIRETKNGKWQTLQGGRVTRLLELKRVGDEWLMTRTAQQA